MAPGRVVEWRLRSTAAEAAETGDPVGRKASFNQDKHFTVAEESRAADDPVASWVAVTFEVAGPLDEQALAQSLLSFVQRHEVLRCAFRRLAGEVACEPFDPASLTLEPQQVATFETSDLLRAFLVERFKRSIDTLSWPLFIMGAVEREDSATVYLAFDHIVCDGMSMPIVAREVSTGYEALCRGESVELPPAPAISTSPRSSAGATCPSTPATNAWTTGRRSWGRPASSSRVSSTWASSRAGCT